MRAIGRQDVNYTIPPISNATLSLIGTSITAKGQDVLAAALGRTELGGLKCVWLLIYLANNLRPLSLTAFNCAWRKECGLMCATGQRTGTS